MGTSKKSKLLAAAAVAGAMGLLGGMDDAKADIITWQGGGTGNNANFMENTANWVGNVVPTSSDIAVFGPSATQLDPAADTGVSFLGMTVDNSLGLYTIDHSGNPTSHAISLGAAGLTVTGGGNMSWAASIAAITVDQNWFIDAGTTVTTASTTTISLAGKLTKTGAGTLFIGSASAGAGGIEVSQGTVATSRSTSVAGTGFITVDNGATFEARNGNIGTNAIVLNDGATFLGTGAAGGFSSNVSLGSSGATVSINSGPVSTDVLNLNGGGVVLGGDTTNVINVGGVGTVLLSGGTNAPNAFTGLWKVNSGANLFVYDLQGLGNRSGASSTSNVANPSRLELAGGTIAVAGTASVSTAMNFNNNVSVSASSGILIAMTAHTFGTTAVSGISRKFGALSIGSSTLTIGLYNAAGSAFNVTGGTTSTSATEVGFTTGTLFGNATFNVTGTTATTGLAFTGAIGESGGSFGVTKTGGGFMNMGVAGTYTGGTTVTGGQLNLGFFPTSGTFASSGFALSNNALITMGDGGNRTFIVNNGKTISGTGTFQAGGGSGVTLAMAGAAMTPGGAGTIGTLTLAAAASTTKAISISTSGTANSINMDVAGETSGQYDQLVLSANSFLGSFANTNLVVSTDGVDLSSFTGAKLAIISAPGINFTSTAHFSSVLVNGSSSGFTMFYENGDVAIAVPEPASMSLIGLAAAGVLRRRRRSKPA